MPIIVVQHDAKTIRETILAAIPDGRVLPDHDEKGHWYRVTDLTLPDGSHPRYASVTGALQVIKDEGLMNYKMNRAVEYVFEFWKQFTDENVMEHLDHAANRSAVILKDAADIGAIVHDSRLSYFKEWIEKGVKPEKPIIEYLVKPADVQDVRGISALRALGKFIDEVGYEPIVCELFVYSHKLKVAGTLDDIGLLWWPMRGRRGRKDCAHEMFVNEAEADVRRCLTCEYKARRIFALLDLKTSNQFKNHYFFQVGLYYYLFYQLTGLRPQKCIILKVDKEKGVYQCEELKRPSTLASYGRSMIRTNRGLDFIRALRRDNQKTVLKI